MRFCPVRRSSRFPPGCSHRREVRASFGVRPPYHSVRRLLRSDVSISKLFEENENHANYQS
jgi:hypothetical protein